MSNLERYIEGQLGPLTDENSRLRAEVSRLSAENAHLREQGRQAEQGEQEATGVMDRLDATVGDALSALGLDLVQGHGFACRVDVLVGAAKRFKDERDEARRELSRHKAAFNKLYAPAGGAGGGAGE